MKKFTLEQTKLLTFLAYIDLYISTKDKVRSESFFLIMPIPTLVGLE